MTTVERLFVQIFERKNRIIEQVKQQTDLYSQHLASKLLLDGVTPPPWLWNPNFNSETSDPKELKKEDLISELLFPHPRQGVPYSGTHCSLYSQPVVVGDNGQLSEGLAMDAHACDKDFNAADRPTIEPNRHDNNVGCVLNCVHELDTSATSPQGQIESMISNIYTVPDQSLARIQRSKSRQKALELRKSAKSTAKIHLTNDNGTSVCSSRNKLSRTAFRWPEQDIEFDKSEGRWAPGDHVSKEKSDHVYCGRITRSRSSCNPSCHENKISKLENSSNIAKEDLARLRNVAISCVEGMLKPISSSVQQRISRSKSGASKNYPLSDSLNRSEHLHPQNFSGDDVIPTFPDSNSIVNQQERTDCVEESLPISGRLVEVLAANTESDMCAAGLRLENSVSRIPSGCRIFVKPKVLDFDDVENCSLNENFCSMLEMERLEKSSGKQDGTSAKSITSQDKITFDNPSRKSLENQSLEQEVLKKTVTPEACRGSFETFAEEQVLVDKELSESKMNKNLMNVGDNKKADKEIQHCPVSCVVDGELQQISDGLGAENHDKCELGFDGRNRSEATTPLFKQQELEASVLSSLTKHSFGDQGCPFRKVGVADLNDYAPAVRQCYVEDDQDFTCPGNELDKGNTSDLPYNERTMQEKELHVREEGLALGSVYSPLNKSMHLITSQNIELQLIEQCLTTRRRLRSSAENSWPLFKRRKIEAQVNCFSASPSFRVKEIQNISGLTANRYLKNDADKLWSDTQFQFILASPQGDLAESHIDKNSNVESHRIVMTQEIMHSPELQHEQDELSYEEGNPNMKSSSTFNQGRLGLSAVSSFTKEVGGDSTACSIEYAGHISRPGSTEEDTMSTALDVGMCRNADTHQKLLPSENAIEIEDKDGCSDTGKMLQETGSHLDEDGLFSSCSVASPKDEHLGSIAANQIMPEFEGFILDTDEKRQQHVTGNDCSFEKLDLPGTTIERAIALEQLCKSASMHTPLSEFSATFKLHKTPALYHSVPNGFLKDMDTRNTLNLKDDVGKNTAFPGLSYSDCVPFADACHAGSVKTLPTSPGGNLWNRISSYCSFSVRQTSSNPEITCFRIDEDPSISEEIENRDEAADMVQEEYSKPTNFGARREPFAEITETCANIPVSAPSAERYPRKISLDSIRNEVSWAGTRNKVKDELENCSDNRCTSEAEKCTLPVGTNCINKVKESLHHRFSKPKLSGKTSLRKGGQRLSKRDSKRNNIVSNITSFVPLVQQKQAAATAVGTGKRDIKVKALEAAEAAKRLEEKRQNERKMKKEALKLERARKQQENLREMELKKKKKEEEQKKKDADMAARKRLREEEERKEKERKRKRMEEARQQQREQEEKLRIGKLEKISSGATDKKVSSGTKSSDISREQQRMADKRVDDNTVKKTENVRQVAADNAEAPTHHIDTVEPTCISTRTDENDALVANTIHQESYEISPYQCSDDEDDDEDEMPTRKFIPSWASKNSVALVLFSQQNVDPDSIFPPESFCSIDEVLRPRKSHIK